MLSYSLSTNFAWSLQSLLLERLRVNSFCSSYTHSLPRSSLSAGVQKLYTSLADDSLSSRRKLFDTLYIRSVSKSFLNRITYRELKKYWNLFVYIQTKSCRNMALKLNSEGTKSKCSKLVQRLTQDFKKGGVGAKLSKFFFASLAKRPLSPLFAPPPLIGPN